jgi:hypothetical protein
MKFEYSRQIFEKSSNIKFDENSPVRADLHHAVECNENAFWEYKRAVLQAIQPPRSYISC